jgi:hypothetical protein
MHPIYCVVAQLKQVVQDCLKALPTKPNPKQLSGKCACILCTWYSESVFFMFCDRLLLVHGTENRDINKRLIIMYLLSMRIERRHQGGPFITVGGNHEQGQRTA